MKIAQVTPVYPPRQGGIGVIAHEYTTRLCSRGHLVEVFTPSRFKFGNAGFIPFLSKRLRYFDLVHLHYPFFGVSEFLVFNRARRRIPPIVLTYHMDAVAAGLNGAVFAAHRRLIQPFILRQADVVLVSSLDYARSSALADFLREKPERIVELPFGIEAVEETTKEERQDGLIVFVGGLDRAHDFKGVPVLLAAIKIVVEETREQGPAIVVAIVGDGDRRSAYERLAAELGLLGLVRFLGRLSDAERTAYLRRAAIHVLPSINRAEAFGLVTLEAAACATPSIISDLPGTRTLIENGRTGFLVRPGQPRALAETILKLLRHPAERERMGQMARRRVLVNYRWDALMDRLFSVYERVVATHGRDNL